MAKLLRVRLQKISDKNVIRVITSNGYIENDKGKKYPIKTRHDRKVAVSKINVNGKTFNANVTKLVAESFLINPYMYNDVKHIDGNIENNDMSNLEWVHDAMQIAIANGEEFKDVSYNNEYKISTNGIVIRVYDSYATNKNGDKIPIEHVVKKLKPKINNAGKGYYHVNMPCIENGVKVLKTKLIHRLVAEAFIPNLENKSQVNHIDGNKLNNHVSNLEWNTSLENIQHAIENGLIKQKGEDSSCTTITNDTVKLIIQDLLDGKRGVDISKKYDMHESVVGSIKAKRRWKSVWDKDFPNQSCIIREYTKTKKLKD